MAEQSSEMSVVASDGPDSVITDQPLANQFPKKRPHQDEEPDEPRVTWFNYCCPFLRKNSAISPERKRMKGDTPQSVQPQDSSGAAITLPQEGSADQQEIGELEPAQVIVQSSAQQTMESLQNNPSNNHSQTSNAPDTSETVVPVAVQQSITAAVAGTGDKELPSTVASNDEELAHCSISVESQGVLDDQIINPLPLGKQSAEDKKTLDSVPLQEPVLQNNEAQLDECNDKQIKDAEDMQLDENHQNPREEFTSLPSDQDPVMDQDVPLANEESLGHSSISQQQQSNDDLKSWEIIPKDHETIEDNIDQSESPVPTIKDQQQSNDTLKREEDVIIPKGSNAIDSIDQSESPVHDTPTIIDQQQSNGNLSSWEVVIKPEDHETTEDNIDGSESPVPMIKDLQQNNDNLREEDVIIPEGNNVIDNFDQSESLVHDKPTIIDQQLSNDTLRREEDEIIPEGNKAIGSIQPVVLHHSVHSIENARYRLGEMPRSDHLNDDRHFVFECEAFKAFGVFDGHDGSNASVFASAHMKMLFETQYEQEIANGKDTEKLLAWFFQQTEKAFFDSMRNSLNEKKRITQQLKGLSSYEAYMQYPDLVECLQQLDPLVSGGTTAVVAVVVGDTLYVANTGDSRAVLVQQSNGDEKKLTITQLSEDHTVENDSELQRLEALGLDPLDLKRAGRLGSQENTRCIGDFLIKDGYKAVDTISHASEPPGIASPSIMKLKLSTQAKYLCLMTDGVYKSIESMKKEDDSIMSLSSTMDDLISRLQRVEAQDMSRSDTSKHVLVGIEEDHHLVYQESAQIDVQSPLAVECRKRDDMTLLVCHFGQRDEKYDHTVTQNDNGEDQKTHHDINAPVATPRCLYSKFSIENGRYSVGGSQCSDHPNDDRSFIYVSSRDSFKAFGVFDGHDGSNASVFASQYMENFLKTRFSNEVDSGKSVEDVLLLMFEETESQFFDSIRHAINEKKQISKKLQGLTSYEAYMQYPLLVARLQELDPALSGGTTVVVAVVVGDTLYVANTGDSRAVLVQQLDDKEGTLFSDQLTEDHTIDNQVELCRLQSLGLDMEDLKKAGRLGSQENTRCIGDYLIKEGYTDMDAIKQASEPPGIAIPSINKQTIPISSHYLLLMTDGVYKTIESRYEDSSQSDAMQELTTRLLEAERDSPGNLRDIAKHLLVKLEQDHQQTYQESAQADVQSPIAVQCRKRDDMTLIVYRFGKIK